MRGRVTASASLGSFSSFVFDIGFACHIFWSWPPLHIYVLLIIPNMKTLCLIATLSLLSSSCLYSATLIFESDLYAPLDSGGSLISGKFFLKVSGDSAEYQIWSGEIDDIDFDIESAAGGSFSQLLGNSQTVTLGGCDLTPRNPFLPFDLLDLLPFPPVSCDALKHFQVYEGVIDDPAFIQSITSGDQFSVSFDIGGTRTSSPATGSLIQVPEPSSVLLASLSALSLFRRNRPAEQDGESDS
jgi:hypothetical protein